MQAQVAQLPLPLARVVVTQRLVKLAALADP